MAQDIHQRYTWNHEQKFIRVEKKIKGADERIVLKVMSYTRVV